MLSQRLRSAQEWIDARFGIHITPLAKHVELVKSHASAKHTARVYSYLSNSSLSSLDEELLEFLDFAKTRWHLSCSQWWQDLFVMYATQDKQHGAYIEVGGADGFTHSNTIALRDSHGWSGVLAEPDWVTAKLARRVRQGDEILNVGLSPSGRSCSALMRCRGQVSSLKGFETRDFHSGYRMDSTLLKRVRLVPLGDLLARRKYDYLSLDIEGPEVEVLSSVDWGSVYKPKCLTVEHGFDDRRKKDLINILSAEGYGLAFPGCDWLCAGDLWFTLSNDHSE